MADQWPRSWDRLTPEERRRQEGARRTPEGKWVLPPPPGALGPEDLEGRLHEVWEWVTVAGSTACITCRLLDGVRVRARDVWFQAHPNCRCVWMRPEDAAAYRAGRPRTGGLGTSPAAGGTVPLSPSEREAQRDLLGQLLLDEVERRRQAERVRRDPAGRPLLGR